MFFASGMEKLVTCTVTSVSTIKGIMLQKLCPSNYCIACCRLPLLKSCLEFMVNVTFLIHLCSYYLVCEYA
jgi:hypothetical protein